MPRKREEEQLLEYTENLQNRLGRGTQRLIYRRNEDAKS